MNLGWLMALIFVAPAAALFAVAAQRPPGRERSLFLAAAGLFALAALLNLVTAFI